MKNHSLHSGIKCPRYETMFRTKAKTGLKSNSNADIENKENTYLPIK